MVITFRLPSIDDAAEMMRIQKRKKQGAGGSSAAAMATTARIESAPSPLRPPPPLHRLHNTTATVDNVVAGVGTGTPPLAISPGQTCRRPGKNNRERAQAKDHPRQHYIQHKHAPIISWGGKLAQPAASAVDLAAASATTSGGGGSQITRGVDEDEPLPWPPTLSSLHLQPRPLHSHSPQIHLPNPSFGEEDFGILAGCIENLDSMGSVDDSSVVFIDSIRQGETSGGTSFHATATADDRHYSSCMTSETENVMAAARTAAATVLEGSSTDYGSTHAFADTSQSRSIPASALSGKDALPTQSLDKGADVITTMETKMTPPSVPTTDDFMRRSHSSESVVVTSPSRNGDSNCSRSTVSHPPSSPEPFLLLTPAGMPGASPPTHQHLHMYETSPTSLHWDEEYATMEQFFKDVTGEGPTSTCTTSHPNAGEVVVGQDNLGEMSSGKEGLNNALPDGACGDVGGGNFVQFSPVKSKCDVLYDCRSPLLVEGGMGGMEQKHIRTQQHYHQAHKEDNRHLASNIASPISLGIVMTSLSTSSVECIDAADIKVQTSKKSKKENKKKLKKNKNRNSPVKSTILLTPQNQLYSPPRSSPSVPLPSQPQLNQENETGIDSIEVDRFNDLMHPSKATLEQYDNELYHKLKSMHPPQCMIMPQSLVPSTMTGNRLVILQGSSKRIKHYETEECVLHSTHALYQFLSEIYPALEDCTYLLPGLQQRRSNSQRISRCEEEAGIDLRSKIHVSSLGNFALGHLPGLPRSDKSKLTKFGLKIAKQRVECAIYAFGGTVTRRQSSSSQTKKSDKMSIFRVKKSNSSSTTQSSLAKLSSQSSSCGVGDADGTNKPKNKQRSSSRSVSRKRKYEEKLRQQYFEHGDRLSWDVQANLSLTLDGGNTFDEDEILLRWSGGSNLSDGDQQQQQQKKNRCKKCGQIKQGHDCPYSTSMQRSIGVMVYPSVNAYEADEPGNLAPALCEMNNFISIKGSVSFESNNGDEKMKLTGLIAMNKVQRSELPGNDVAKLMIPNRRKTLIESSPNTTPEANDNNRATSTEVVSAEVVSNGNSGTGTETYDLLFQPTMEITIDQYRSITPKNAINNTHDHIGEYVYPQVPLTFTQRKSLSDTLFSLSKRVPKLTEECAFVLTMARKNDQWDLAVAELMTQVLCVIHSSPTNDFTLEGLRAYLLTLGIVC